MGVCFIIIWGCVGASEGFFLGGEVIIPLVLYWVIERRDGRRLIGTMLPYNGLIGKGDKYYATIYNY